MRGASATRLTTHKLLSCVRWDGCQGRGGRGALTSVVWSTKTDIGMSGRRADSDPALLAATDRVLAAIDTASERARLAVSVASARLSPSVWLPASDPARLSASSREGRGIWFLKTIVGKL